MVGTMAPATDTMFKTLTDSIPIYDGDNSDITVRIFFRLVEGACRKYSIPNDQIMSLVLSRLGGRAARAIYNAYDDPFSANWNEVQGKLLVHFSKPFDLNEIWGQFATMRQAPSESPGEYSLRLEEVFSHLATSIKGKPGRDAIFQYLRDCLLEFYKKGLLVRHSEVNAAKTFEEAVVKACQLSDRPARSPVVYQGNVPQPPTPTPALEATEVVETVVDYLKNNGLLANQHMGNSAERSSEFYSSARMSRRHSQNDDYDRRLVSRDCSYGRDFDSDRRSRRDSLERRDSRYNTRRDQDYGMDSGRSSPLNYRGSSYERVPGYWRNSSSSDRDSGRGGSCDRSLSRDNSGESYYRNRRDDRSQSRGSDAYCTGRGDSNCNISNNSPRRENLSGRNNISGDYHQSRDEILRELNSVPEFSHIIEKGEEIHNSVREQLSSRSDNSDSLNKSQNSKTIVRGCQEDSVRPRGDTGDYREQQHSSGNNNNNSDNNKNRTSRPRDDSPGKARRDVSRDSSSPVYRPRQDQERSVTRASMEMVHCKDQSDSSGDEGSHCSTRSERGKSRGIYRFRHKTSPTVSGVPWRDLYLMQRSQTSRQHSMWMERGP